MLCAVPRRLLRLSVCLLVGLGLPPQSEDAHGHLTSLAPHERLPELPVIPREKPHTGATDRATATYKINHLLFKVAVQIQLLTGRREALEMSAINSQECESLV